MESYESESARNVLFSRPCIVVFFSLILIISGLVYIILPKYWFMGIGIPSKMFFYSVVSVPVAFLALFLMANFINYCSLNCFANNLKPIIESSQQIFLLMIFAVFMGFVYGIIFGLIEGANIASFNTELAALKKDTYCYALGIVLGFIVGLINDIMREGGGSIRIELNNKSRLDDDL